MTGGAKAGANLGGVSYTGVNSARPLPPLSAYEEFCAKHIELNPRVSKKSIFRDPKRLRALALAWRTPANYRDVAFRFGYQHVPTVSIILKELPKELR